MNLKMATMILAGSVIVHAVVTACTTSAPSIASAQNAGSAAEVSPETCSKSYDLATPPTPFEDAGTRTVRYAEHAYPGKSKEEIAAHVTHWTTIDSPGPLLRPTEYQGGLNLQLAVYTRDGFAGAGCEEGKTTYFIWSP